MSSTANYIINMKSLKFVCLFLLAFGALGANTTETWVPYVTPEEFSSIAGEPIEFLNSSLPLSSPSQDISTRAGVGNNLWPNAQVPYTLDRSLNDNHRREVAKAIQHYHDHTCIRFIPKQNSHRSWVNIEYDANTCGVAQFCMGSGQRYARFGGSCMNAGVMIHELGHTLCMGHEQTRQDRDEWISWDTKKCEPHGKDGLTRGLHKLYDYVSVEHYEGECYNGCIIPKQPGVTKCGSGGVLSVLDIELLNEVYGCTSGCHGLRFVNHESGLRSPIVTGKDWDETNLYSCRAYHNGDIIPGKYRPNEKACYVARDQREHRKTGRYIEVLTSPHGTNLRWVKSSNPPANAVKGGRSNERETLYVVQCQLNFNGKVVATPGKWHRGAWASIGGREYNCGNDFYFLVCG